MYGLIKFYGKNPLVRSFDTNIFGSFSVKICNMFGVELFNSLRYSKSTQIYKYNAMKPLKRFTLPCTYLLTYVYVYY